MKHLRETFTDEEFKELQEAKGTMTWHDFIMAYSYKIIKCEECGNPIPQRGENPIAWCHLLFCSVNCMGTYLEKAGLLKTNETIEEVI